MLPQWTVEGERILCTLLEVCEVSIFDVIFSISKNKHDEGHYIEHYLPFIYFLVGKLHFDEFIFSSKCNSIRCTVFQNHVISVVSPEEWYRKSIVGKRKAFNREGPLWKVTVGAVNGDSDRFTRAYRNQFTRACVPVKKHLGSFLVSEEALPSVGTSLDVRHFNVGQYVTATGKTIDWGFQGGMHRWGMRGQPARNTTKSHRRIGSIGSTGDARVWPGKRMPGHMGYEWVTVSGLE
ncbi:unnamed protein product, partial [Strongylus vulgaris]